jgi:hypothetical protein
LSHAEAPFSWLPRPALSHRPDRQPSGLTDSAAQTALTPFAARC